VGRSYARYTHSKALRAAACGAALEAARYAFNGIATVNARRSRADQPMIRFGVGLHVGEVVYGNVGAPDRLAFTVMGPAVNRAARLEGLTKDLAHPVLTPAEFAAAVDEPLTTPSRVIPLYNHDHARFIWAARAGAPARSKILYSLHMFRGKVAG